MNRSTDLEILGIGVSPHKNDGVLRFERFCNAFGLKYRIVGEGKIWNGGDMFAGTGGGQKVNELLKIIENMENKLIVICDTFDLFPLATTEEILHKFDLLCKPGYVLFSSEVFCWPDEKLAQSYPQVDGKYKYLNSGSIIGYRDDIFNLIKEDFIRDNEDDQLFYSRKFLSGEKIILDYGCELFQALNGASSDIIVHKNRVYNKYTNSYPSFVHGNGLSKIFLNHIENYIQPNIFEDTSFTINRSTELSHCPKIFLALYIDSNDIEQLNKFIEGVRNINYHNKMIHIYDKRNNNKISELIDLTNYSYTINVDTYIFDDFKKSDCEFYLLLEQRCIITEKDIIHKLLPHFTSYRRIISPLLHGDRNTNFTNFWGKIDKNGFYDRSEDYMDLIKYQKRGLWNSPYVCSVIIIDRSIIMNWNIMRKNKFSNNDKDMQLCYNLRRDSLFMYMVNFQKYGYMIL